MELFGIRPEACEVALRTSETSGLCFSSNQSVEQLDAPRRCGRVLVYNYTVMGMEDEEDRRD